MRKSANTSRHFQKHKLKLILHLLVHLQRWKLQRLDWIGLEVQFYRNSFSVWLINLSSCVLIQTNQSKDQSPLKLVKHVLSTWRLNLLSFHGVVIQSLRHHYHTCCWRDEDIIICYH
jgi:hypothetical protein